MKRCASHPMLEDRDQNSNGDPESAHNLPSPVPKLSLQIDPYSPASADCKTLPSRPYGGPIGPKLPCSCPPGDDAQAVQVVAARHLAPEVAGRQGSRIVGNPEVGTWTNSRLSGQVTDPSTIANRPMHVSSPASAQSCGFRLHSEQFGNASSVHSWGVTA
jgi:hypothetical protein